MLLVFLGGGSLACFSSVLSRIERLRKKNFHRSILGTNMNFPLFPHSLGDFVGVTMEVSIDGGRTLCHFFISETKRDFD